MSRKDYIPGSDALFNQWQNGVVSYTSPRLTAWRILPEVFTALTAKQSTFVDKYELSLNPEFRTPAATLAKTEARAAYEKELRTFIKENLAYNHLVSDENRRSMQLPVHDAKPSPSPPIKTSPVGQIDFSVHQRHTLHVTDTTGKKHPDHARGFEAWYKIGDVPTSDADFVYAGFSSSTVLVVDFPLDLVGQTVHYRFRWINTRNVPGPWSETIISAVIA